MITWSYEKILTPGGSEKRLEGVVLLIDSVSLGEISRCLIQNVVADEDDLCATRQGRLGSGPERLDRLHPRGPQRRIGPGDQAYNSAQQRGGEGDKRVQYRRPRLVTGNGDNNESAEACAYDSADEPHRCAL